MAIARCLVDTNILLRMTRRLDSQHKVVAAALARLAEQGTALCYTHQNIAERWNTMTRPAERNGLGLSVAEAEREVLVIEAGMSLLPENEHVYREWRQIVVNHGVMGVQVHDARLAAAMYVHGVPHSFPSGQCSNVNSGILQQNCARLRSNTGPDCQGIRSRGFGQ